jgi:hypothetical protein
MSLKQSTTGQYESKGLVKGKGKGKGKEKAARAGPSALNSRSTAKAVSAFTLDSVAGPSDGSYALPAPPAETDVAKWKRKKQVEAFEGVEGVSGEGPFGYYNCMSRVNVWIMDCLRFAYVVGVGPESWHSRE